MRACERATTEVRKSPSRSINVHIIPLQSTQLCRTVLPQISTGMVVRAHSSALGPIEHLVVFKSADCGPLCLSPLLPTIGIRWQPNLLALLAIILTHDAFLGATGIDWRHRCASERGTIPAKMAKFVRIGVRPALYRVNVICWSRQLRLSRDDWQWRIVRPVADCDSPFFSENRFSPPTLLSIIGARKRPERTYDGHATTGVRLSSSRTIALNKATPKLAASSSKLRKLGHNAKPSRYRQMGNKFKQMHSNVLQISESQ